jgi:hypothetical protein
VRLPREAYPIRAALDAHLPQLRPAQRRGLALWVYGAVLAGSACQAAVVLALLPVYGLLAAHAVRQDLREWLYGGRDKAAPCATEVDPAACFAPLLGWVLAWWRGRELALALDATALGDRLVVLSVCVLSRGGALPVAWHVLPANREGAWLGPILGLLERLAPAVPGGWTVLLLADRGLWSPAIWDRVRALGWHPLPRVRPDATFRPLGGKRQRAASLVPGPGHAWVGAGTAFKHRRVRRAGTLVVAWEAGQAEPWLVLTDLAPAAVGPAWYGLRAWVELGFRALKGVGWRWERTRRTDPERVARHWLVLAVATLWVLATGTRVEEAALRGVAPANLRVAVPPAPRERPRRTSVFALGLVWLRWQLARRRRLWRARWLWPEAWPDPPPGLAVVVAPPPA